MRILIPGISGQLGRVVACRLLDEGHEVIGIDRRPWPDAPASVEIHSIDLRKRAAEEVFRKSRPHAVVHMATVTHLVETNEERYRINLGGTRTVFDNSRAYGVEHVIFVGRHTYYGAGPESPLYHTEEEPPGTASSFPELADLVAADLYASTALWRAPELCTTVLRMCYTLGPTGHGTLASFLRGARIPYVLGFDPLFQFMHETDVATAISLTLQKRIRGVYNVAGPQPVPLSMIIRAAGRAAIPLPEVLIKGLLGRFGLPNLPRVALSHIKYPVVVDSAAFRAATGFKHAINEARAIDEYRMAHPLQTH